MLSDEEKRELYDRGGLGGPPPRGAAGAWSGGGAWTGASSSGALFCVDSAYGFSNFSASQCAAQPCTAYGPGAAFPCCISTNGTYAIDGAPLVDQVGPSAGGSKKSWININQIT